MKTFLQPSFILSFCLITLLLTFSDQNLYGQCTTGCTIGQIAISPISTNLTASSNGQTLCIQGNGAYTGNIDFNGKSNITLCIGPNVTIGTGVNFNGMTKSITINNYGTVTTNLSITTNNGNTATFNNYGTLGGGFSTGSNGVLNNKSGGQINGNSANFNGGTFNNEAGATFTRSGSLTINNTFTNLGTFTSGALTINSSGNVTLAGTNTINGDLNINGDLTVTGTPTISGNVLINGSGTLTGTGSSACNTLCPTGTITNNGTLTSIYLCKSASGNNSNTGSFNGGTVASTSVCSGSNVPLTVTGFSGTSGTTVASVLRWESSTDAGFSSPASIAGSVNKSNITITNITATTYYRAVIDAGGCGSLYSSISTVTVSPVSVGGAISGGATVCSGTNSGTLTLSGQTGSILRWESSTNSGFSSPTTIANTTTSQTYTNLATTIYYRAIVQSGTCATANSTSATMTISPASVGGTISGGATVCSGTNSGTLTLSGQTGSILRWESSTNSGFSSPTTIANTTTSQTYTNLATTTYYRAIVQSGSCATANSTSATVTVNPASVGGTISGTTTVCSGSNSGTLTLSGQTGSIVRWESANNSGFSSPTTIANTTTSQTYTNLATTTYYRAIVQSGSCATGNATSATVTVNPLPTISSTLTGSVCSGSPNSYTITSATAGATFTWTRATVTGISNTAGSGSTASISETLVNTTSAPVNVTYVLRPTANSCVGTASNLVITVIPPSSITTSALSTTTLCAGSTNNISFIASCDFDSDNQFTAQLSDASGSFTNPVNIGSITGTTSGTIAVTIPSGIVAAGTGYRIRVVSSEPVILGSDNGTDLTVQVYSVSPLGSQSFITSGTTAGSTLTASGSNITSYQWGYYTTLGGAITDLTGKTSSTYTPQGSHFPTPGAYYVVCKMATSGAGCGLAVSNAVTMYVNCPQPSGAAANLVINGDFSSGNTGFTTQYTYVTGSNSMYPEGTYNVGNNPYSVHDLFCNMNSSAARSPVSGGNMLIGNAATNGSKNLWVQTIAVTPNTDYVLTFWGTSLGGAANSLQFGIYAGCFRTGADIEVVQSGVSNCTWTKFTVQLNSGTQTSVDLAIRNISVTAGGNDVAIDDIVMYACSSGSSNFSTSNAFVWRGFTSDWTSTDNWGTSCSLPACGDAITIPVLPAGKVYPIITTSTATASTVNISNGATLSVNAGANLTICGDLTNNGSLTNAATGTITFANNKSPRTPQVLTGNLSGVNMLGNLTINNATSTDIVQLANAIELTGNLTITSGVLNANGKQIKMAGNFTNAGTFTPNSNTVEFRGSSAQQISQTGTGQFYDLKINKTTASGTLTFNPTQTTITDQLILTKGIATTGSNEIYISNNAATAVTGHSASSYVNGKLRRAVTGVRSYDYPVGDASRYELMIMQINVPLGVSNVMATFHSGNPSTGTGWTAMDNSSTDYSMCTGGSWDLTPDVTAASTARYHLMVYPVGFSCGGSGIPTFVKRHDASSPWSTDGSTYVDANTRTSFKTFSEIVIATGNAVSLPVRLISFSGQLQGQQVQLTWITASEENNAYFQVERSRDGLHFEPIGLLDGSGTTQTRHTYTFMDTEPLPGIGYYRLRQVDRDGQFELSKIIAMKVSSDDQVNLFPNPAQRGQLVRLRITTQEAANYELIITDQQGRIMLQESFDLPEGEKELTLPGSDQFPAGLYVIKAYSTELFALSPYQGKLIVR